MSAANALAEAYALGMTYFYIGRSGEPSKFFARTAALALWIRRVLPGCSIRPAAMIILVPRFSLSILMKTVIKIYLQEHLEDNDKGNDERRVYVWINGTNETNERANTLLESIHDFTIDEPSETNNVYFDSALAKSIYTNTSFQDLLIGAERYDALGTDAGIVYVYEGSATGFLPIPATVCGLDHPAIDAAEQLGSAITVLDFNDAGVEDLIIGASADDALGTDASSVYFKLYKHSLSSARFARYLYF